jgi:hypothetical protein
LPPAPLNRLQLHILFESRQPDEDGSGLGRLDEAQIERGLVADLLVGAQQGHRHLVRALRNGQRGAQRFRGAILGGQLFRPHDSAIQLEQH